MERINIRRDELLSALTQQVLNQGNTPGRRLGGGTPRARTPRTVNTKQAGRFVRFDDKSVLFPLAVAGRPAGFPNRGAIQPVGRTPDRSNSASARAAPPPPRRRGDPAWTSLEVNENGEFPLDSDDSSNPGIRGEYTFDSSDDGGADGGNNEEEEEIRYRAGAEDENQGRRLTAEECARYPRLGRTSAQMAALIAEESPPQPQEEESATPARGGPRTYSGGKGYARKKSRTK